MFTLNHIPAHTGHKVTSKWIFGDLFKNVSNAPSDGLVWNAELIRFNPKLVKNRHLMTMSYYVTVGEYELRLLTSCNPFQGSEPKYVMGSSRFGFDYCQKFHDLGRVGAFMFTLTKNGEIIHKEFVEYSGQVQGLITKNQEHSKSISNKFAKVYTRMVSVASLYMSDLTQKVA